MRGGNRPSPVQLRSRAPGGRLRCVGNIVKKYIRDSRELSAAGSRERPVACALRAKKNQGCAARAKSGAKRKSDPGCGWRRFKEQAIRNADGSPERRANLTGSDGKAAGHCMGRAEATGWHPDVRVVAKRKMSTPAEGQPPELRDGLRIGRLV